MTTVPIVIEHLRVLWLTTNQDFTVDELIYKWRLI